MYTSKDRSRLRANEPFSSNFEPEPYRNDFRRDYDRLVHCPSFRRLQGKTQLFPGIESDFFRNRLTHSLEVAQISKSIAIRLNNKYDDQGNERTDFGKQPKLGLSYDLAEFAALAHDLGHPPFGHQGEYALDKCMQNYGGFEGNAQTLRILTRMEKKFGGEDFELTKTNDNRVGLNLTMRALASILKYDFPIPHSKKEREAVCKEINKNPNEPIKGYYKCDEEIINLIKLGVAEDYRYKKGKFKTLECSIMDIADDIAYSTYDLEDGLKAGFISPLDLLYPDKALLKKVCDKVNKTLENEGIAQQVNDDDIVGLIKNNILNFGESDQTKGFSDEEKGKYFESFADTHVEHQYKASRFLAENGALRTSFTSSIVGKFIRGVILEFNKECPALSVAKLTVGTRILVEIFKTFTYESQIQSPRLKIAEYRGKEIVTKIFDTLNLEDNYQLMPHDVQKLYTNADGDYKQRIICDYISSMTDKYAIEFYGRLTSEDPQTIFKPF